jgi:hypothetical protein
MRRALVLLALMMTSCAGVAAGQSNSPGHDKKPICHVPPGNPSAAHIIYPDDASYDAHLPGSPGGHDTDFFVDDKHPCPPVEETTTTHKPHDTTTTTEKPHETTTTTTHKPHETTTTTTKPPHETTTTIKQTTTTAGNTTTTVKQTTTTTGGGGTTTTLSTTTTTTGGGTTTTSTTTSTSTTTTVPGGTTTTTTTIPGDQVFVRAAGTTCDNEVPKIIITFGNLVEFNGHVGTLTMRDLNGNVISVQPLTYQVGTTVELLYPGTAVNPDGSIADVPGWILQPDGFWVEDPSDTFLRDGIDLTYEVNPTATARVTYPPASAGCNTPTRPPAPPGPTTTRPPGVPPVPGLPPTGNEPWTAAVAALTLAAGALLAVVARRRRTM